MQIDGYKMHRWGGGEAFPSVITVFSAPDYCGTYKNKGAVILIENDKMNIKQYKNVEHPFHLPNDMDLFAWSFPFLSEKVNEMLLRILAHKDSDLAVTDEEINKTDVKEIIKKDYEKIHDEHEKMQVLRAKVITIAKMSRMFRKLRENNEELVQIKKQQLNGKIP